MTSTLFRNNGTEYWIRDAFNSFRKSFIFFLLDFFFHWNLFKFKKCPHFKVDTMKISVWLLLFFDRKRNYYENLNRIIKFDDRKELTIQRPSQKRLDKKWMKSNQCVNINSNQISNKIYSQQFSIWRQTMEIYYENSNANIHFLFKFCVWEYLYVFQLKMK